jgi:hypothetical protein
MKIILATALLAISTASHAGFIDGNKLASFMRAYEDSIQKAPTTNYVYAAEYSGYVKGVHDSLDLFQFVCTPKGATSNQSNAIVAKFLKAHPERWAESASLLVTEALKAAFPCQ